MDDLPTSAAGHSRLDDNLGCQLSVRRCCSCILPFAYYSRFAYFISIIGGGTVAVVEASAPGASCTGVGCTAGAGVGAGCWVAATTVGSTESACEVSAFTC